MSRCFRVGFFKLKGTKMISEYAEGCVLQKQCRIIIRVLRFLDSVSSIKYIDIIIIVIRIKYNFNFSLIKCTNVNLVCF